jgi:hypothetical protein
MNGYELSRNWFDWSFENPELISPTHTAIYFFAIEHCNRLGWKDKFGFPTQMAMDAIGVRKHQTFTKHFNDLVEWGFIGLVQKSKNQYSANIISLISAKPKKGKALDKALVMHGAKHSQSTGQSTDSIDKQETMNNEQETNTGAITPNENQFKKPTQIEISIHLSEKYPTANKNSINTFSEKFWSHYENNGWKVGKNKMKNWKLALTSWSETIQKDLFPSVVKSIPSPSFNSKNMNR